MARCSNRRRDAERGFALLLIFLMAGIVAILLYMELPRYAMQAQRDKEEMLIDRGEQYKRAIQLFVNKTRHYPADIKDLENFQNQRFLRQRYADPMTGKDEWRLIHIQGGMLTDSKVTKPNNVNGKDPKNPNGFVGEQVGLGGPENQGQMGGAASVRDRRRASEGANATMPGSAAPVNDPNAPQAPDVGPVASQTGQPGQPGYPPGVGVPGQAGIPGQPGVTGQPGQPGYPGMPGVTPQPGIPPGAPVSGSGGLVGSSGPFVGGATVTGSQSSDPNNSGQTMPGQGGNAQYPPQQAQPGAPQGFPQPGSGAQGNAAADMIRNILTTPRPGGMPTGNPGQTFGGGIAGVASTAQGEGVKVYNERTLYEEWEFIFDPAKQKQIPNPNGSGLGGVPAGAMSTPIPGQQQGAPGVAMPQMSPTSPTSPGSRQ